VQPLALWPSSEKENIFGVFTDIDDTLTSDGAITDDALLALTQLKDGINRPPGRMECAVRTQLAG
jgi:hypothetical protein